MDKKEFAENYSLGDELSIYFHLFGKQIVRHGTYKGFGVREVFLLTCEGMVYIPFDKILGIRRHKPS